MADSSLLRQWRNGIRIEQVAHRRCAASYNRNQRLLGIPVVILTTAVGTSLFATLGATDNQRVLIAAGIVSAFAAILSGLQTFLNYGELSARHETSGREYGQLRKQIDEALATEVAGDRLAAALSAIREAWGVIEDKAPTIPQAQHDKARLVVLGPRRPRTASRSQAESPAADPSRNSAES